ncbi:MAG: polymerase, sigma 28 subunit, FliA/WhiG [Lachnospiraceae bacterium]|jgi:RNA polymerase sigma factor for flagellar operon FliA|nr:polymerase, sigma 28 subunit, FliA/WhiG [Anaerocolumna sp.]MDF2608557.1 polymerase, sigma 28 subunit, FliA/WhiG [Lachnospiraceae bacterium]
MNADSKAKLWEEYSKSKSTEVREKIIIEYANLVKIVAGRLSMYLGYNVEYDDLVGYGIFGLIDAVDKFDYYKGIKFETYASFRIRGAIIDEIRKMDWVPRTLRQKQKKIDVAFQKIELEKGRLATEEEVALELNITIDELDTWQNQAKVSNLLSLDEYMEQGSDVTMEAGLATQFETPEGFIEKQELRGELVKSLDSLTEKEKKVIILYYYEELTLKEISSILEVSESRVSQLHTKALQKMRLKLGNYSDALFGTR